MDVAGFDILSQQSWWWDMSRKEEARTQLLFPERTSFCSLSEPAFPERSRWRSRRGAREQWGTTGNGNVLS